MAIALSELQRRFFDRMDEGASQYVTAAQATDCINEAYSLLWGMYTRTDDTFFESEFTFTPTVNVRDYPLPANFRRLLSLYMIPVSGTFGTFVPLQQFGRQGYIGAQASNYSTTYGIDPPRYRLLGANVRIDPPPTTAGLYAVQGWYLYHYTPLVASTDTLDPATYPGHEQWIINQAVIQLKLGKEEQPTADLSAANAILGNQIVEDLKQRDVATSKPVLLTSTYDGWA